MRDKPDRALDALFSMSPPSRTRTSCPHCGNDVGLRWSSLLPSNSRARAYKCRSCGGRYDLSDGCRMASLMAGVLSMGPGVLLFGRVVKAGGSSKLSVVAGTAVIALTFGIVTLVVARVTLRLESRK